MKLAGVVKTVHQPDVVASSWSRNDVIARPSVGITQARQISARTIRTHSGDLPRRVVHALRPFVPGVGRLLRELDRSGGDRLRSAHRAASSARNWRTWKTRTGIMTISSMTTIAAA